MVHSKVDVEPTTPPRRTKVQGGRGSAAEADPSEGRLVAPLLRGLQFSRDCLAERFATRPRRQGNLVQQQFIVAIVIDIHSSSTIGRGIGLCSDRWNRFGSRLDCRRLQFRSLSGHRLSSGGREECCRRSYRWSSDHRCRWR